VGIRLPIATIHCPMKTNPIPRKMRIIGRYQDPLSEPPLSQLPESDPPLSQLPESDPPLSQPPELELPLSQLPESDPPVQPDPPESHPPPGPATQDPVAEHAPHTKIRIPKIVRIQPRVVRLFRFMALVRHCRTVPAARRGYNPTP
jgi:hypothetical protein